MLVDQSKIFKSLIFLILLFCVVKNIYSQNFPFGHITVEDGLSNSSVNCLLQDHFGFLWFGTDDGLNRYDGYDIKVYRNNPDDSTSLSENIIWAIYEDSSGFLWIGTKNGNLNRYDPSTDKFESWGLGSELTKENSITCIYEDRNNSIWIGTYKNGLYKFDQSKNRFEHWQNNFDSTKVISDNFITSILEDNSGRLWISTYNGLNRFNPNNSKNPFTQIYNASKDFTGLTTNLIWYLGKSKSDPTSIWMGTINGLTKFNPGKNNFVPLNLPESEGLQFGMSVSSLTEEITGQDILLWVGTFGGLIRINLTTGDKERFIQGENKKSGLLSNQVNEVITDRSGVIWIATDNGLNFYSPKSTKFNFPFRGQSNTEKLRKILTTNTRAVTQSSDSSIWIGTEHGLYIINNFNSEPSINTQSELKQLNVWCLSPGNSGNIWIGTYGEGLKSFNLNTNTLKSWKVENPKFKSQAYKYVKTILQDKDGMVWIGFWGGGLARLNPVNEKTEYWRNESEASNSLSYNDIWALLQDSMGRIWIGTNGGGLDLFDKKIKNNFYHWRYNKIKENSLSSNSVYSICESVYNKNFTHQIILWVGTGNGLNKFVINENYTSESEIESNTEITSYTVNDGLPDNSIESIVEDENGNLWIGTSSGISFFDLKKGRFINYTISDGLNGDTFNSNSAFKTADGLMIFGSNTGFNIFDPKQISQSSYSPTVLITDFQVFNKPVLIGDYSPLKTAIFNSKEIHLSFSQNVFSFQFSALDFNSPQSIRYAYKMAPSSTGRAARRREARSGNRTCSAPTGSRLVMSSGTRRSPLRLIRWNRPASSSGPACRSSTATAGAATSASTSPSALAAATAAPLACRQISTRWLLPDPAGPESSTARSGQAGQPSMSAIAARLASPVR